MPSLPPWIYKLYLGTNILFGAKQMGFWASFGQVLAFSLTLCSEAPIFSVKITNTSSRHLIAILTWGCPKYRIFVENLPKIGASCARGCPKRCKFWAADTLIPRLLKLRDLGKPFTTEGSILCMRSIWGPQKCSVLSKSGEITLIKRIDTECSFSD